MRKVRFDGLARKSLAATLAAALLLPACVLPASAAFQDLGAGARAPGMGNAFTAIADDLYAVYYNPAGLAQVGRPQLSTAYTKLYTGLTDGSNLGTTQMTYAQPLKSGRWGGIGTSFQRFALNSLYSENSLYMSYGRVVRQRDTGSKLMLGLSAKYLQHSFSTPTEASSSCNNGQCNFGSDPVLAGPSSKGSIDADFGLLYRFPRKFQLGLMVQHLMEPDVGFAGGDKLKRAIRFAGAYKSLWLNLLGEIRMTPSPAGTQDKDLIFGAEKFIPTLDIGEFGLRGSLGFGSREWKQLTMGLGYRINKIELDYAFLMPIGTIDGTAGTHTISLTFHFGAPTSEEELSRDLLEQQKDRQLKPDAGMSPHDINDPRLVEVLREVQAGRYRRAYRRLEELITELPPDTSLVRLGNRLRLISNYYPQFTNPKEKWENILTTALWNIVRGSDRAAMLQVSYASSLNPHDKMLENFLNEAETLTAKKAERAAPDSGRDLLQELLYRMEAAHNNGDYRKVFSSLSDIQVLDPTNATALERAGSTYYILGRYQDAITVWDRAIPLEESQKERESLQYYMEDAHQKLKGGPPPKLPAMPPTPKPAPVSIQTPQEVIQTLPRPEHLPVKVGDPRDIPALYQRGVEHYARGEFLQATSMFMRILQIDPENIQAKKALERIRMRSTKGQ